MATRIGWRYPDPGENRDECVAIGCLAKSEMSSLNLPLCEPHLIEAYRQIGEYIRAKREHAAENPDKVQLSEELPKQLHWVGRQFGVCPECDYMTLLRDNVTGEVRCAKTPCTFTASREQFDEMVQARIEEMSAVVEVVYYVRFGDRVKIGTSRNLESRLAAIPHDEVLATEPGGLYVERQRHQQFKHLRTKVGNSREWFEMAPELIEHIAALKARQAAA